MPTYTTPFAGGVLPIASYGQRDKFRFFGTWAVGDTWSVAVTSTLQGDFTIGKGNIAAQNPTCGFKLRNRVYLGINSNFALCANNDVTLWEEQNPGAAVIEYLSQYGSQDAVVTFSQQTGRLAVFGRKSIQLWKVDADPANFALDQTLDNTGTRAPLSVSALGDLDVMYLHDSGFRSLRANQMYLNATTNDIGTAIDSLVQAAQLGVDPSAACSVVDPTTRQYWCYLNGNIYVLSNYPSSKIVAWSIYKPTKQLPIVAVGSDFTTVIGGLYYWTKGTSTNIDYGSGILTASGSFTATQDVAITSGVSTGALVRIDNAFVPEKFVVYLGQIYLRTTIGEVFVYGGTDNNTYDRCRATVELPWLDNKAPCVTKHAMGVDAIISGEWTLYYSLDPRTAPASVGFSRGSLTTPIATIDSTFDVGHFPINGNGTHIKIKMVSGTNSTAAKLAKLIVLFKKGNVK